MNRRIAILKLIEYGFLFITAGICLLISSLDLAGMLDSNSWIVARIPSLTLLAIGSVASYLILERRGKLNDIAASLSSNHSETLRLISESTSSTIQSLDGVEIISFHSDADGFLYLSNRLQTARKVDDITWEVDVQPISLRDREALESYRRSVIESSQKADVIWREIAIFRTRKRFERFKQRLVESLPSYNLAYYEELPENSPAKINFLVIDNQEVFLLSNSISLVVRQPDIVQFFSSYYERLWSKAKVLKVNSDINYDALKELEAEFERHS